MISLMNHSIPPYMHPHIHMLSLRYRGILVFFLQSSMEIVDGGMVVFGVSSPHTFAKSLTQEA